MNTWQLLPTATRRFVHLECVMLCYNRKAKKWSATFFHNHTEVRPQSTNRTYKDISEHQMNRILSVYGLRLDYWEFPTSMFITASKPKLTCMYPGCNRPVSVPTYQYPTGYCVDHRGQYE